MTSRPHPTTPCHVHQDELFALLLLLLDSRALKEGGGSFAETLYGLRRVRAASLRGSESLGESSEGRVPPGAEAGGVGQHGWGKGVDESLDDPAFPLSPPGRERLLSLLVRSTCGVVGRVMDATRRQARRT